MSNTPYNPLDKLNLAQSIQLELLRADLIELAKVGGITGAGVYAIYYAGPFQLYSPLTMAFRTERERPIYVGKAIPKGGRKGGLSLDAANSRSLAERLGIHGESIEEAKNLSLSDFYVRSLVVEDIWIPLGENMLIETFKPIWNTVAPGFGNKAPGSGRQKQKMSRWDTLHPGRIHSELLPPNKLSDQEIALLVSEALKGHIVSTQLEPDELDDGDEFDPGPETTAE